MRKRGLLIFDLDGTLFQTDQVSIPAVQEALRHAGYAPPPGEEIAEFFGRPPADFYAWIHARYPGISPEVVASIDEWELCLVRDRGALYPGVGEMLAELRRQVSHMAICSNGPGPYVQEVVRSHGLAPFFDDIRHRLTDEDNKPVMVAELLARLPGRPAAVIGDRWDDIAAAHENGLLAIASAYGFGNTEEHAGADAVVRSPREIVPLVGRWLNGRP